MLVHMKQSSTPIGNCRRLLAGTGAAAAMFTGFTVLASAQPMPPQPPGAAPVPPGLAGDIVVARPYLVQLVTPSGRYVTLHLHNGTVINPLGTTLQVGMRVSAFGTAQADGSLHTDEVDLQPFGSFRRPRGPGRRGPRGGPPRGGPLQRS